MMKTYYQFMTEVFDKSVKHSHEDYGDAHRYEFKTGRAKHQHHSVMISHENGHADVDFYSGPHDSQHMTGSHGTHAVKVVSGVHHILKKHLERHPDIHTLHFSAENDHGRVALYRRMAKKHGDVEEHQNNGAHKFTVKLHGR